MSDYPWGAELTMAGKCPVGGQNPAACMLCEYGHMLECHYPMNCYEANCYHYQRALEEAGELEAEEPHA